MSNPAAVGTYPFEWKRKVYSIPDDICITPYLRSTFDLLLAVATMELPILIQGRAGTGKDVFARLIHALAGQPPESFKALNCAGKNPGTLESEVFGNRKGAWTGAAEAYGGLVEAVGDGTLFLDEIADHPPEVQGLWLRFLQNRTWYRMGEDKERRFSGRILAATNKDLEALVGNGKFREDLFDRLTARRILVKELKDRPADIVPLTRHLAKLWFRRTGVLVRFSREAEAMLRRYPFPGNIRKLDQIFSNVAVDADRRIVTPKILRPHLQGELQPPGKSRTRHSVKVMLRTIQSSGENRALEARKLGVNRTSWYRTRRRVMSEQPSE